MKHRKWTISFLKKTMKLFLSTKIPFLPTYLMHGEIKQPTQRASEKQIDNIFATMGAFLHSVKKRKHTRQNKSGIEGE
jgi:hypothetical protein